MLAFTWAASSLLVPLIFMTRTPSSGRASASRSRSSVINSVQLVDANLTSRPLSISSRHIVSRRIVSRRICSTYGSAGASYIKKLSLGLVVLMAASSMPVAEGVCIHCKGTIAGCQEGDLCPLVADIAANQAIFEGGQLGTTPTLVHTLPSRVLSKFPKSVCDKIVGIATAPIGGREVDFGDAIYATATAVCKAALYGHCTIEAALLELTERVEQADDPDTIGKLRAAMDLLKARANDIQSGGQQLYQYLWMRVASLFGSATTLRLQSPGASTSKGSSELSTSIRLPSTQSEFSEMLHIYMQVLIALGRERRWRWGARERAWRRRDARLDDCRLGLEGGNGGC